MAFSHRKYGEIWWFLFLGAGVVLGTWAVAFVLVNGHSHEFNASWEPPWGILIATYEFLVLVGLGLSLAVGIGRGLGWIPSGDNFSRKALQFASFTLFTALITAIIELSHPMRLSLNVGDDFYSAVVRTSALYGGCALFLGLQAISLGRKGTWLPFAFALGAWLFALGGFHQMGNIFGILETRPAWHTVSFFVRAHFSAVLLGTAVFPLVIQLHAFLQEEDRLAPVAERRIISFGRVLLFLILFFLAWILADGAKIHLYGPEDQQRALRFLLSGPLALNFWLFEILAGLLIPLLLLRGKPTASRVLAAGFLVVFGQFFLHFNGVVSAQLGSQPHPSGLMGLGLSSYISCIPKTSVSLGAFAFCLFLFTMAEKVLPPEREN